MSESLEGYLKRVCGGDYTTLSQETLDYLRNLYEMQATQRGGEGVSDQQVEVALEARDNLELHLIEHSGVVVGQYFKL